MQKIPVDKKAKTIEEIQTWLSEYIANLLDRAIEEINPEIPFERYGLDSAAAISMIGDLENWLTVNLDATLIYEYPTIKSLAIHIVTDLL